MLVHLSSARIKQITMGIEKVLQFLQSFTHPHVILNLFDFLSLMEHHHNIILLLLLIIILINISI